MREGLSPHIFNKKTPARWQRLNFHTSMKKLHCLAFLKKMPDILHSPDWENNRQSTPKARPGFLGSDK